MVTKNIDLCNNFIQLKTDFEEAKKELNEKETEKVKLKTSQIYLESPIVEQELPPDFTKRLESAIAFLGSKHSFECIFSGTPPLTVKWFKNGVEIEPSSNLMITYDEKNGICVLTLNDVSHNDNALFACRVNNELGMAETSAYLKVKEISKPKGSAPLVVTPLESVQLNAGSHYTLECIISGDPEPKVTWYKDNIEIELLPESVKTTFKVGKFMNVRQLTITNTEPELHSGTYTCRAKNEYGEADCTCGILVRSEDFYFTSNIKKISTKKCLFILIL